MSSATFQPQFGSRWWKIDFHVHTPASGDYGHGNQSVRVSTTPEDILKAAMSRKLDAIVVTDHVSGGWIDELKQANHILGEKSPKPDWYRELVIFPGVEIAVSGGQEPVHMLALFDPNVSRDTITGLLGRCGITGNFGDATATTTSSSLADTIDNIYEFGGIPIFAHIDAPKGYLHNEKSLPDNGRVFYGDHRVYAAEFANVKAFDTHPAVFRKVVDSLAKVGGSDAHLPEEIGRFSSWIKMSSPSISSMKLALQSPEWSVKNQNEDPNREPNLVLQELTITDMKHCGRVSPCKVCFSPHQTSLIGGRGSGKSTVVESVRIALAQDKILDSSLPRVQGRIDSFMAPASKKGGVMLGSTTIELVLRRNEDFFKVSWCSTDSLHKVSKWQDGKWIDDLGNPHERFSTIVLSQKQIEELADNPLGLLGIIDKRIGKLEWDGKWRQVYNQFLQLRERERELRRKLQEESMLRTQLADVESDLAQFEKRGDGKILKRYQRRQLQMNALREDDIYKTLSAEIRAVSSKVSLPDFPAHLYGESDETAEEQRALHDGVSAKLNNIRSQLDAIAEQVDAMQTSWVQCIQNSAWYLDYKSVANKYKELVEEYEKKNSRLDMSVYNQWIVRRNLLLSKLKQVESVKSELSSVQEQIKVTYQTFKELRGELLNMRREFIAKAIGGNGYVKMSIVPFGDIGDVESAYRDLLALESGKYKDAILSDDKEKGILSDIAKWDADFAGDAGSLPQLIENIKMNTIAIVNSGKGMDAWLTKKLQTEYAQRPQSFDNLLSWFPEDSLRVQYSKNDSSGKFADLKQGSAGQKAAALLAFLLGNGEEPIIIDQPEDDLDNALVYDLVVKQLHESKNRRQIIVATHNPNIVVNGDSELVQVFHFEGGQVKIAHSGGLDNKDIREDICTIMEGGKEAFERRYKRMEIDHV